jgi:hypothetical protein
MGGVPTGTAEEHDGKDSEVQAASEQDVDVTKVSGRCSSNSDRLPKKWSFLRLLKNAQMQVEPCKIPFAGAPEIPCRERIYAFPTDVRRNKPAPCFDTGKDEGWRRDE